MALKRMDNVGIVVEDLDEAIAFFKSWDLRWKGEPQLKANGQDVSRDL